DLEPGTLHLEITEKVIVEDPARAIDTFERLKALGVHIHIDDFGTGYSSLSMLSHFPVDILKTYRTFIDRMGFDKSDLEIVRAVFSLARSLDMEVIAEGVENGGQLTTLREMGCRFAQGFFFAKPLRPAGVAQLLSRP
ncbi:MAG TPA: EAL domain-containing protein, partial [Thermoleophilia bacterium]|nr:EAL domain-containing protein [Thermoleophilia bacterium]